MKKRACQPCSPRQGVIETVGTVRDFMECGGKRSVTPLWLERLVLGWIRHKHKPKRRRASLAAALPGAISKLAASLRSVIKSAACVIRKEIAYPVPRPEDHSLPCVGW